MTPSNTLFIFSDEHSRRVLGSYGHEMIRTPNLDALAAQGIRFADAYLPLPHLRAVAGVPRDRAVRP